MHDLGSLFLIDDQLKIQKKNCDVEIKEKLEKIKEQIGNHNVKIIAVTKYANQEQILEAYKLGISNFGESYVQDAQKKFSIKHFENSENLIKWHFIGRLQKNKARFVVGDFCLIHSVHSVELAELINVIAIKKGLKQDILLQVNISQEATKSGFSSDGLKESFKNLVNLSNLNIKGLMTMAPKTDNKNIIKSCFSGLFDLKEELNKLNLINMQELSMGMTDDYKVAIECRTTIIRIGRGIFNNNN